MGRPWEIVVGEVRRVLRDMPSATFDACLSDPPYGLRFMGNRWDYQVPSPNVWVELLRVLRPGAFAMLFGGTKTFHRMMVNVEDAGFLPADTCMWMHGKGFPKNHDVSKALDKKNGAWRGRATLVQSENAAMGGPNYGRTPKGSAIHEDAKRWEGYGTALKPSWEPIMLACKPHDGTYAENALRHGCGALAIDASRIGSEVRHLAPAGNDGTSPASIAPVNVTGYEGKLVSGRWPANALLSHAEECVPRGTREVMGNGGGVKRAPGVEVVEAWDCVPGCPVRMLDEQSGSSRSPGMSVVSRRTMRTGVDLAPLAAREVIAGYSDFGGASRFYYVTKASRQERDRGLEATAVAEGSDTAALRDGGRGTTRHNDHPTVKPLDLCRYFARMLLPPPREDGKPRRIIVPYCGSGSEMIGCLQAGWDEVVGIELDPKHADKARLRISRGKIIQHARR